MDKSSFDAAGSVQFNLDNGVISSSVKGTQLALLPVEILTALQPGVCEDRQESRQVEELGDGRDQGVEGLGPDAARAG